MNFLIGRTNSTAMHWALADHLWRDPIADTVYAIFKRAPVAIGYYAL
jgi:hypothetical protein